LHIGTSNGLLDCPINSSKFIFPFGCGLVGIGQEEEEAIFPSFSLFNC
jgi:hypothetical protein